MDHFETYADAGRAQEAREERMERKQAEIDVLADELYEADLLSGERWADALADFAWWPPASVNRAPDPALVHAIKALMAGDDLQFAHYCRTEIEARIKETAREAAELRLNP